MSELTKRALGEALKSHLEKTPMKKITVKNIVEDCGVNRRTLYYNFNDLYDLLEWVLNRELMKAIDGNIHHDNWDKGFQGILEYLYLNRRMIDNIHGCSQGYIEQQLNREVLALIMGVVDEISEGMETSNSIKERVANFYRIALMGTIMEWIDGGMKEDPLEIVRSVKLIIQGDIYRALEKCNKNQEESQ